LARGVCGFASPSTSNQDLYAAVPSRHEMQLVRDLSDHDRHDRAADAMRQLAG
jgi:hypothetical protein